MVRWRLNIRINSFKLKIRVMQNRNHDPLKRLWAHIWKTHVAERAKLTLWKAINKVFLPENTSSTGTSSTKIFAQNATPMWPMPFSLVVRSRKPCMLLTFLFALRSGPLAFQRELF